MIRKYVILVGIFFMLILTGCHARQNQLTVFYAPCFSPVLLELKDNISQTLNIHLQTEVSGSQMVCRKITELRRECDLMLIADASLFKNLTPENTSWRIEFAHDEVVLGIGIRARRVDDAEKDWIPVLRDPEILLGRVDENLGPIGYRTLLVWQYLEQSGYPGLREELTGKTAKVLDHVDHLAAMLKNGDMDYGFIYKTTCRQNDIRYLALPPQINQGSPGVDYARSSVSYQKVVKGKREKITVPGSIITYGLSIPHSAPNRRAAIQLIHFLLNENQELFKDKGYQFYKPQFYGSKSDQQPFSGIAVFKGEF